MSTHAHPTAVIVSTIARWLVRLSVWGLAAGVVLAISVVIILPRATQGFAMTVLTGSMTPEIPVGSVVLVRPVDPNTLEVGDVATYRPEQDKDAFITHRVIDIERNGPERQFVFKGDANSDRDFEPVPASDVVGQVWFHVPFLGSVRDALHGKAGLSLLAMVVLGGYALTQLGGAFGDSRRSRRGAAEPDADAPDEQPVLAIDRTLVLVELALPGDEPCTETARRWGGLVVAESATSFTLLLAPPEGGLAATLEVLGGQQPLGVQVWEPPVRVFARPAVAAAGPAPAHATDPGTARVS